MKKKPIFTFQEHLEESLKDPEFKKIWEEERFERELGAMIIGLRIKMQMSQRALAKKLKTSQAAVCRLEIAEANPSLSFLKRLAKVFNKKLVIEFR